MERAGIAPAKRSCPVRLCKQLCAIMSTATSKTKEILLCALNCCSARYLLPNRSYILSHPTPSYPVLSRPILSCPVLCLSIARNWGMSTPNISSLTEKAPCLQLLNSHKTTAWLVARGTPGHISVVPGGKVHVTGRMDLLSHLSHITFSMHTEHQQGGAGFGTVESDQEQALPALQPSAEQPLSDSKGRVPRSLSACHYIPGRV